MLLLTQNLAASGSAPIIGTLNGYSGTLYHGQSCTLTGVNLDTSGTVTLRQGSLSQAQTTGSWADTSITFTANTSIFAYGPIVIEVAVAGGTAQANFTLIPVAAKSYIVVDVPWPGTAYSVLDGASPAAADGDQLEWELATNNGGVVTMFADGTFSINDGTQAHTFNVRVFDQTDLTWSSAALITVSAASVIQIFSANGGANLLRGQVGAIILGNGFGGTAGTVTIGGVAATVTAWSNNSITVNVAATTPIGSQLLRVDTGTTSATATVVVATVAGAAPVFLGPTISISGLAQNVAMAPVAVAARFQDPIGQVLTFSTVGTWPAGLTVTAASGSIQGTPTIAGTYNNLAVRATDPDGNYVDSNTFTIAVAAPVSAAPTFIGPNITVASLLQNTAMTALPFAARFQDPAGQTLTFSAQGTWPPGVIVSATGTVQGTPTTVGSYSGLQIRATDPDGNFIDSNVFAISVAAQGGGGGPVPPPVVTPPPSGDPGTSVSDVAIANRALTKLGAARIISFADDTKEARAIAACYYILRDAELRRRKWRFALKRAQIPALTETPAFGYAYAYQIPADCLSILTVGDIAPGVDLSDYRQSLDTALYSLEGRTILTDLPAPLNLRYKARITDPTQFDLAFVEALAARIAWELCEDLTQSSQKKVDAQTDYKVAIREAIAANAVETAPEVVPDSSWLLSRQ